MSRHWKPRPARWLSESEFKALSPKQRRALFAARGHAKREKAALDSWHNLPGGGGSGHRLPESARAGLVLVAAACLGIAVGASQAFGPRDAIAPGAKAEWSAGPAETIVPEVAAGAADAEWAARADEAEGWAPDQVRGSGTRTHGVRAAFTYCHTGGGANCVVDGDTFWIGGDRVRIAGIDAPETHPPRCAREAELGEAATRQLQGLLSSGAVTMTSIERDRDRYGRLLRNVAVNGRDVGEAMMSAGLARAYAGGRRPWC